MWAIISRLVLRLAALRWLVKLGGLGLLLPIAFLLKVVGVPLLAILSVVAMPVLMLLFLFGLPIFLVLIVGGMVMGLLGAVLTLGVMALKIGLLVVLPIWVVWRLASGCCCGMWKGGSGWNSSTSSDRGEGAGPGSATGDTPGVDPA